MVIVHIYEKALATPSPNAEERTTGFTKTNWKAPEKHVAVAFSSLVAKRSCTSEKEEWHGIVGFKMVVCCICMSFGETERGVEAVRSVGSLFVNESGSSYWSKEMCWWI